MHDASHTPHRLQTTLNAAEELVIDRRTQRRLSLDDLLAVVREFIEPGMSRSALDRLLRRRGRCEALGIEHRLTRPKSPQTHPRHGRAIHRAAQAAAALAPLRQRQDLATTLHCYVWLYNKHSPQEALQHITPLQAMKRWRRSHPHLFSKQVRNHPGPDSDSMPSVWSTKN